MRIRLLLATICIFALPMWFSPPPGKTTINSATFATVAFAGHTSMGGAYCDCGTPDCICDPGERPGMRSAMAPSDDTTPSDVETAAGFDPGVGAMIFMLALIVTLRMRF